MVERRLAGARAAVGWGVLALGGLVIGLAALRGSPEGPVGGGPGVRVALRLPEPLLAAVFACLALSVLLLFVLLLPRRRPRKRKEDEEFALYYEPPKLSPWALLLIGALALAPVAVPVALVWSGWMSDDVGLTALHPRAAPPSAARSVPQPPSPLALGKPAVSLPAFSGAVGLIALLAALGGLGLMLWILLGDRLAGWRAGAVPATEPPEPFLDAVDESLDDLRQDPDVRRAIILCYRRFEQGLARSGLPRAFWETPTEFMTRALSRLRIPAEATETLTRLFELSRFSHHALGPGEREAAVRSLIEIRTALQEVISDASAA